MPIYGRSSDENFSFLSTTADALTYHQFVGNLACIHIFELFWGITLPFGKVKLVSRELKVHFNIDFITNQLYFVRTCSTTILAQCLPTRFCFRVLLECLLTSYVLKFSRRQIIKSRKEIPELFRTALQIFTCSFWSYVPFLRLFCSTRSSNSVSR